MGECVNVSVARISIVNSFYFKYHTCKKNDAYPSLPLQEGQTAQVEEST